MSLIENIKIKLTAQDQASKTLSGIQKKIVGIGAAYLGWQAVSGAISSIVEHGIEAEKAITDLNASLERHGLAVDSTSQAIMNFANEMQTMSGISDETIIRSTQTFVDFGNSAKQSMDLIRVSMDLAAGGNMDLASAVDLVGKASVGYTSTLSRYGIIIDENIPKAQKFEAAIKQINERFGGAAVSRMDTFSVKLSLLKEQFGDLQEKIFVFLVPALRAFIDAANIIINMADNVADAIKEILDYLKPTNEVAKAAKVAAKEFGTWQSNLDYLTESFKSGKIPLSEYLDLMRTLGGVNTTPISREDMDAISGYAIGMGLAADVLGGSFVPGLQEAQIAANKLNIEIKRQETISRVSGEAIINSIVGTGEAWTSRLIPSLDTAGRKFIDLSGKVKQLSAASQGLVKVQEGVDSIGESAKLNAIIFEASLIGIDEYGQALMRMERDYVAERESILAETGVSKQEKAEALTALWSLYYEELTAMDKEYYDAQEAEANASFIKIASVAGSGINSMVDSMVEGRGDMAHIFKGMAQDFAKYFIKSALAMMLNSFLPGLGSILGGMFDTPRYDKMAMTQGEHFANYFSSGVENGLSKLSFASNLASNYAPPLIVGGGGGSSTIINNYNGVVSEDFIHTNVVPAVGIASKRREVNIYSVTENSLGGSYVFS